MTDDRQPTAEGRQTLVVWMGCDHGREDTRCCVECYRSEIRAAEQAARAEGYRKGLEEAAGMAASCEEGVGPITQRILGKLGEGD